MIKVLTSATVQYVSVSMNTLYTLSLYSVICQLHLNKINVNKKDEKQLLRPGI